MVSVDVKQHLKKKAIWFRAQELCESRGGHPGLPVPNSPYGLCGRKATLEHSVRAQELCGSGGGRPGLSLSLTVLTVSVDVKQH